MDLKFHHTGIAVSSIEETLPNYIAIFGKENVSEKFHVSSQEVNVCFVEVSPEVYIELIESTTENSAINRMIKKGISYYHVAYLTKNIEETVSKLISLNYKEHSYFYSEAFKNKRCIFLHSPDAHLIELIEQ
jgi:4-hydroxyphenylpyruvate dioxygenase-like putative hemolysin